MAVHQRDRAWRRRRTGLLLLLALASALAAKAKGWGFSLLAGRGPGGRLFFQGQGASSVCARASKEGEPKASNPIQTLQNVVQKTLGRRIQKGDIVYNFMKLAGSNDSSTGSAPSVAQVKIMCIDGQPERLGPAESNEKAAKRAVAKMLLADPDFLIELILAKGKPEVKTQSENKEKAKTQKKKKAEVKTESEEKRIPMADLALGQEVSGFVKGGNTGGVYIDIGATVDAYLPVSEIGEGFPKREPFRKNGTNVSGRVLWKADDGTRLWITRRSGELVVPTMDPLNFNASALAGVSSGEWFDGKVVRMTYDAVKVEVSPPGGGEPITGILRKTDISDDFFSQAGLQAPARVRIKNLRPNGRVEFTMQQEGELKISDMVVGQELQGKVRNRLGNGTRNTGQGWFIDVGAERDVFLDVEELSDGIPRNFSELRFGKNLQVRVLKLDDGKVWVTRRTGDLARPADRLYRNLGEVQQFEGVDPGEWLEGQVVRMRPPGQIFVRISPPSGDAAVGLLNLADTTPEFREEAYPGINIKVRVKKVNVTRKRMLLTMKTPRAETEAAAEAATEEEPAKAEEPAEAEEEEEEPAKDKAPEEPAKAEAVEEVVQEEPEPETTTPAPPKKEDDDLFSFLKR